MLSTGNVHQRTGQVTVPDSPAESELLRRDAHTGRARRCTWSPKPCPRRSPGYCATRSKSSPTIRAGPLHSRRSDVFSVRSFRPTCSPGSSTSAAPPCWTSPPSPSWTCSSQVSSLEHHRAERKPEQVILVTGRPASQPAAADRLQANIAHWTIETGLHARLDASRHNDTCHLRCPNAVWLQAMFTRWAKSLFIHWRQTRPSRRHATTTDLLAHRATDHARRATSAVRSKSFSW